jgi:hypothetical protein
MWSIIVCKIVCLLRPCAKSSLEIKGWPPISIFQYLFINCLRFEFSLFAVFPVRAAFALQEKSLTVAAQRATLHCCVEASHVFQSDISGLLFGLSASNAAFGDALLPVMIQEGIRSVVVIYTITDPYPM